MRQDTRLKYNAYTAAIAQLNGTDAVSHTFAVTPTVQQRLETRMQESSSFLQQINVHPVNEIQGEKIGLGVGGPIASRTDTDLKDRETRDPLALDANGYHCVQTNYDTHIKYATLDAWAKFPDFQARLRDSIIKRQALDRILIGFNGKRVSATTDLNANPLLEDVNKGWLQKLREYQNGAQWLKEVKPESGAIKIGDAVSATEGYKNLDALVMDMIDSLIAPWYQEDPALVVVLGRSLLADKYFPLVNKAQPNSELTAADVIISQKRVGGKQAVSVPFFPANGLLITRLDNLSIYFQEGARRRYIQENPKRNRIENYESSNDDYVIEDFAGIAGCENIQILAE